MEIWQSQFISMRVHLSQRAQKKLINDILSDISVKEAAMACQISERTIRDWRRGKFLTDFRCLKILCRKTGLKIPKSIKLKEDYWYVSKGSSKGGMAVFKKYGRIGGDPKYRKEKWYRWWEREGKYKDFPITRSKIIRKPKYSKELAEFVGIVLGDGGISQYQVVITLHAVDDKAYGNFVAGFTQKLFKVPIGIYPKKKDMVINYTVSSVELVRFLKKIGLKQGNKVKQQVDIPKWIKRNKEYRVACVRGLVDTDGSVFIHHYKVNGKEYSYKKLLFTSRSEPLRQSVFKILSSLGIRVRLDKGYDVRIDSKADMAKYFKIVGSHNPKHLNKYRK
jgi:intein/homing endonuclease